MTAIRDLEAVETEHLLGDQRGPLVKMRCTGPNVVLVGQLLPAQARKIAADLQEAAARAEYEADFYQTARAEGWTDDMIGAVVAMVCAGEVERQGG